MAPSSGPSRLPAGRGQPSASRPRGRNQPIASRGRPRSSSASEAPPSGASTATFFSNSNQTRIRGGEFSINQGNVTITVNQGTGNARAQDRVLLAQDSIESPLHVSRPVDPSWSSHNTPVRSCEIYYRQLLVKNRGSPLWVPAPNTMLPLSYQREGLTIGDLGIITDYGGFDYLFNNYLPRGHPNNPEDLPEDFVPLPPLKASDVRAYSDFRPNSYLASSSVTKSRRSDTDPSGLTFESSNEEAGAILTMPQGSNSLDMGNRMRIRRYAAANAERWYRYAHDVRGREANNGDLRVVIGWDRSSTWGMAVFSKTTSQNGFRLKFKPKRGHDSDVGQLYDWECESGTFEGRTGPHENELAALRAGDPDEAGAIYENQCLFVRTLNVTLNNEIWLKLISETDYGFVLNDLTNMNPSPSLTSPSSMASSYNQDASHSPGVLDNYPSLVGHATTATSDSPQISRPPSALAIHPLNYVHNQLLKAYPNARMVITEDDAWMSVLNQDDTAMPEDEALYQRIIQAYNVVEEDGFIFLESKMPHDGNPSWATDTAAIIEDEQIGISLLHKTFRGQFAGRAVAIRKLVFPPRKATFYRNMELWTELAHPNILSTYAATTKSPFLYITPFMAAGNLVQFLRKLDKPKATHPLTMLGLPQPSRSTSADADTFQDQLLLTMIYEIASGMDHLHSQGIFHGFLKASKVLMDDNDSCVISGFGQAAMKLECAASSGSQQLVSAAMKDAHIRWSSPELLTSSLLTDKADVWAFAITCVEILTMGQLPWPAFDNETVRDLVLRQDSRPSIPSPMQSRLPDLPDIVSACWSTTARDRPTFTKILTNLQHIRLAYRHGVGRRKARSSWTSQGSASSKATHSSMSSRAVALDIPLPLPCNSQDPLEQPVSVSAISIALYDQETGDAASKSDLGESEVDSMSDAGNDKERRVMPLARIVLRYRLTLVHEYHPSLVLPLWNPSMVGVGAVGYLQKSTGSFISLFNAFSPKASKNITIRILPSLHTYGEVNVKLARPDKVSLAKRVLRILPGALPMGPSTRTSLPLKGSQLVSYLFAEDTEYRYMASLAAAKQWLQDYNLKIFNVYKEDHKLELEDLMLVTGTLQTSHYALLCNHSHLSQNAEVSFSPNRSPRKHEAWGSFSIENSIADRIATNVSIHGGPSKAVLIARLRMKRDSTVATTL